MGIQKCRIRCRARIRGKNSKKVYMKKIMGLRTFVHSRYRTVKKVHNSYTSMLITFLPNAHKTAPKTKKLFFKRESEQVIFSNSRFGPAWR